VKNTPIVITFAKQNKNLTWGLFFCRWEFISPVLNLNQDCASMGQSCINLVGILDLELDSELELELELELETRF
jgi:hypothetical protein